MKSELRKILVEDYRTNFGADDDKPDLVCNDCFDEREDDEEPPL